MFNIPTYVKLRKTWKDISCKWWANWVKKDVNAIIKWISVLLPWHWDFALQEELTQKAQGAENEGLLNNFCQQGLQTWIEADKASKIEGKCPVETNVSCSTPFQPVFLIKHSFCTGAQPNPGKHAHAEFLFKTITKKHLNTLLLRFCEDHSPYETRKFSFNGLQ